MFKMAIVGLTLFVAACGVNPPTTSESENDEADLSQYEFAATFANSSLDASRIAQNDLADGQLTAGEYRALLDAVTAEQDREREITKQEAIRHWSRP